jgi:hypothetical protein
MGTKKDNLIRKTVRHEVGDQSRQYLLTMLGSPLRTRLRYCLIILFKLGYRDLVGGNNGTGKSP